MRLTGLLVLLIDDHLDSLEIGEMSLLQDGARVLAAPSADTGLRFLDAHPIDVIVSDISMPRIDGYELVRRIRARRDEKRGTPALAMTGNATALDVRRALDAGFDAHAAKPLRPEALVAHVERLARGTIRSEGSIERLPRRFAGAPRRTASTTR